MANSDEDKDQTFFPWPDKDRTYAPLREEDRQDSPLQLEEALDKLEAEEKLVRTAVDANDRADRLSQLVLEASSLICRFPAGGEEEKALLDRIREYSKTREKTERDRENPNKWPLYRLAYMVAIKRGTIRGGTIRSLNSVNCIYDRLIYSGLRNFRYNIETKKSTRYLVGDLVTNSLDYTPDKAVGLPYLREDVLNRIFHNKDHRETAAALYETLIENKIIQPYPERYGCAETVGIVRRFKNYLEKRRKKM